MRVLPGVVTQFCYLHEAWIVGSAAKPGIELDHVRDFDVLVPWDKWKEASLLIPECARPNTFRGWKFLYSDSKLKKEYEVDV